MTASSSKLAGGNDPNEMRGQRPVLHEYARNIGVSAEPGRRYVQISKSSFNFSFNPSTLYA